jgi:hypothetical protein
MIRRHLLKAALVVLPIVSISGAALAQHPAPTGQLSMEQLHQMLQDIPGPEYATANRLRNEALHGVMMGVDPAATDAKMRAFAQEYSRVAGTDPKAMEAHVLEVGQQLAALAKDPNFQAHMAQLHAGAGR